jgi:predicted alpha/beta hydrolase family esterase
MPDEDNPHYQSWSRAILEAMTSLDDGSVVVGHSIGGTILIHLLATETLPRKLSAVYLVATPYIGPGGWPSDDDIGPMTDLGTRLPQGLAVYLYHGDEDDTAPVAHVDLYARAIPHAKVRRLKGRDHQLNDDLSEVARDIEG